MDKEAPNTQLHSQARRIARRAWQLPNIIRNLKNIFRRNS